MSQNKNKKRTLPAQLAPIHRRPISRREHSAGACQQLLQKTFDSKLRPASPASHSFGMCAFVAFRLARLLYGMRPSLRLAHDVQTGNFAPRIGAHKPVPQRAPLESQDSTRAMPTSRVAFVSSSASCNYVTPTHSSRQPKHGRVFSNANTLVAVAVRIPLNHLFACYFWPFDFHASRIT
jgi:hypothetical protein